MGLTVYFGPPKTFAPVRSACRKANSATAWQMRRSIRSVRSATSSSPTPSRHSFAPYASPTAMRTTEMGAWTPPSGTTPGMRRPVRTITFPPISSRRIRFGEPTSPAPSGVTVAAFSPKPCSRIAAAASYTTPFWVARRPSSERSKRTKPSSTPMTSGWRVRNASSSSSCPVWSPSRTTIVCTAGILLVDRRVNQRGTIRLRFVGAFSTLASLIESKLKENGMARKTILVCDKCGKEVPESRGAMMRLNYTDARRGSKQADLCDDCAAGMPGHAVARRGRRPKSVSA